MMSHRLGSAIQPREKNINPTLGDLLRVLSVIDPSHEKPAFLSAGDFYSWFLDRFRVPPESCSQKTFGDVLTFGCRLHLIRLNKVIRTKAKCVYYIGISTTQLDDAFYRWRGQFERSDLSHISCI